MADAGQVLVNLGLIHRDGEWLPYWDGWIEWMRQQGWRRFGLYCWDQGAGMMGDWVGRFAPSFEMVFHFNKNSKKPEKWVEKKEESITVNHGGGMRGRSGVVNARSNPEASLQTHKIPDSVIRINRVAGCDVDHPAMFPVALAEFAIKSWPGICYEPFSGSGTTIIAGENLGRKVRAIEISPAYVAVALQRFLDHTGIQPNLASQKECL
jgi:DNA modification methylase